MKTWRRMAVILAGLAVEVGDVAGSPRIVRFKFDTGEVAWGLREDVRCP